MADPDTAHGNCRLVEFDGLRESSHTHRVQSAAAQSCFAFHGVVRKIRRGTPTLPSAASFRQRSRSERLHAGYPAEANAHRRRDD
jgi:hypothetical protein